MEKYKILEKFVSLELDNELKKNINVVQKSNFYLYNYNNSNIVERNNPVLIKCRGLVLDNTGRVMCYPFERFFNDYENESAIIDWDSAEIFDKLDGSLINLWWDGNNWEITTRGSFYPNDSSLNYKEEFLRFFDLSVLDDIDKQFTFMFELITKNNRIVKWYEEEKIVLLGARNNSTYKEVSQSELDTISRTFGVSRPLKWKITKTPRDLFKHLKDDDEGFVVVDDNFNRIKIKQDSYIKLGRILMLKDEDIFNYVIGSVDIDSEYLEKCPDVVEKINSIQNDIISTMNYVEREYRYNYDIVLKSLEIEPHTSIKNDLKPIIRKEFYKLIKDNIYFHYIMKRFDNGNVWNVLKYNKLKKK
ncbi:MAG: hypothetical protein EOL97_13505 [Spirochaetia bacterium]|nr:hypothetical protein [Spirochaetia bacterium]